MQISLKKKIYPEEIQYHEKMGHKSKNKLKTHLSCEYTFCQPPKDLLELSSVIDAMLMNCAAMRKKYHTQAYCTITYIFSIYKYTNVTSIYMVVVIVYIYTLFQFNLYWSISTLSNSLELMDVLCLYSTTSPSQSPFNIGK